MTRARHDASSYVMAGPRDAVADTHAYAQAVLELPANFSLVYESADGRLCLFEDAAGHLNAVDTTRLA